MNRTERSSKSGNGGDPMEIAASAVGHLYEAKERLKDAAIAAGDVLRTATVDAGAAVRDGFAAGGPAIRVPLSDAATASRVAASEVKAAASAEIDVALNKGKQLLDSTGDLIRAHPVAAFGIAFAGGYLVSRMLRRR